MADTGWFKYRSLTPRSQRSNAFYHSLRDDREFKTLLTMSPTPPQAPGLDMLIHLATIIESIATNLRQNRLDRKSIQKLLQNYISRAESDGLLLYTARVNQCVGQAVCLATSHMELVSWLVKNNYNLQSTSVRWYSYKKLLPRNRLPLFSIYQQTAALGEKLRRIEKNANLVYTDLLAKNVRKVPPNNKDG